LKNIIALLILSVSMVGCSKSFSVSPTAPGILSPTATATVSVPTSTPTVVSAAPSPTPTATVSSSVTVILQASDVDAHLDSTAPTYSFQYLDGSGITQTVNFGSPNFTASVTFTATPGSAYSATLYRTSGPIPTGVSLPNPILAFVSLTENGTVIVNKVMGYPYSSVSIGGSY
jgi:hypothetical protein